METKDNGSVIVAFKASPEMKARIDQACEKQGGRSMSSLVCEATNEKLAKILPLHPEPERPTAA